MITSIQSRINRVITFLNKSQAIQFVKELAQARTICSTDSYIAGVVSTWEYKVKI